MKYISWTPTGGRSSAKNRTKRSQNFPIAFLVTALHLSDVCSIRPFLANSLKNKGKTLVLKTQNVEVVRSRRKRHFRGSKGGGGAAKKFTEDDFKRRFSTPAAATKENHAHFGRRYEGGNSREMFTVHFGHNFGRFGPANVDKNIFFKILLVAAFLP